MKPSLHLKAAGALFLAASSLASRSDSDDSPATVDNVNISKDNAIEIIASTRRLPDGRIVMHTHRSFFAKKQLLRQDTLRDTLPDLGMETISTTDPEDQGLPGARTVPVQYDILFKVDTLK